jgi:hypothetical protein
MERDGTLYYPMMRHDPENGLPEISTLKLHANIHKLNKRNVTFSNLSFSIIRKVTQSVVATQLMTTKK